MINCPQNIIDLVNWLLDVSTSQRVDDARVPLRIAEEIAVRFSGQHLATPYWARIRLSSKERREFLKWAEEEKLIVVSQGFRLGPTIKIR